MIRPDLDVDELESVDPNTILKYLESNGWVQVQEESTSEYLVWKYDTKGKKEAFILLPLEKDIPDFSYRIYDLIKVLAVVEQRSLSSVFDSIKSAKEVAEVKDREVLNFRLKFADRNQREVLSGQLGKLLSSLQNLVNGIAQYKDGSARATGPISEHILNQSKIAVVGAFEGSFGLRLASVPPETQQLEAFKKPLIQEALQELFELISVSDNEQLLKDNLVKLRKRVASNYRHFLIALSELSTDNQIEWGSPCEGLGGSIELSYQTVLQALFTVSRTVAEVPEEFEITAELIGANKRSKRFEVKDIATGETYDGPIAATALKDIETAIISQFYTVKILEQPILNEVTQEITKTFTLLKLSPLTEDPVAKEA